jgi:16S rRNA (cytosine967-C5)-methyltransferase
VRINSFHFDKETVLSELEKEGASILEVQDLAVRLESKKSLYHTEAFNQGMFEIQDFASQEIGRSVCAAVDEKIWDVCAGAGGKSLQMATAMRSKGAVYCTDVRAKPLDELRKRATRHGLTNVHTKEWDGINVPALPKAVSKQGGFDAILVDAPCTSSGTWRRNPEARFRMNSEIIDSFHTLQLSILTKVASSLKPKGRLIYSTCSWLVQENEQTVQRFIDSSEGKDFKITKMKCCGLPFQNSDAMFYAVLEK